jgi:hypothetical protein
MSPVLSRSFAFRAWDRERHRDSVSPFDKYAKLCSTFPLLIHSDSASPTALHQLSDVKSFPQLTVRHELNSVMSKLDALLVLHHP